MPKNGEIDLKLEFKKFKKLNKKKIVEENDEDEWQKHVQWVLESREEREKLVRRDTKDKETREENMRIIKNGVHARYTRV